jgi:phosphate/phosphite/phosphonate ABC transporter binding protein
MTTAFGRRQALTLFGGLLVAGCREGHVDPTKDNVDALQVLSPKGAVPDVIRVGITPSLGEGTSSKLAPLYAYLSQRLGGRPVEGLTAKSYDDLAVMVREQKVEIAVFSPAAYVSARKKMNAVAIATATRNGSPTYLGYLIVKNHGQKRPLLQELEDKSIAWVNQSSTSGYLYPRKMLTSKGINPDTFFGSSSFANDHPTAIQQVIDGEVDVAAAGSPFVDPQTHTSHDRAEEVMVVAKTERIPLDCLVVHTRIQRQLGEELRDALHALVKDSPDTSKALEKSWGIDGFTKPMHPLYNRVAENIGLPTG